MMRLLSVALEVIFFRARLLLALASLKSRFGILESNGEKS